MDPIVLALGDVIIAFSLEERGHSIWPTVNGEVTYIYAGGKRCIVGDEHAVSIEDIYALNGKKVSHT